MAVADAHRVTAAVRQRSRLFVGERAKRAAGATASGTSASPDHCSSAGVSAWSRRHQVRRRASRAGTRRTPRRRRAANPAISAVTTDRAEHQSSLFDRRADAEACRAAGRCAGVERALSRTSQASQRRRLDCARAELIAAWPVSTPVIAGFGGGLISHVYVEEQRAADDRCGAPVPASSGASCGGGTAFALARARIQHARHLRRGRRAAAGPARPRSAGAVPERTAFAAPRSADAVLVVIPWAGRPSSAGATRFAGACRTRADVGDRLQRPLASHRRLLALVDARRRSNSISIRCSRAQKASPRSGRSPARRVAGARAAALRSRVVGFRRARVARLPIARRRRAAALPALTAALEPRRSTHRSARRLRTGADASSIASCSCCSPRRDALVPIWNDIYRDAYTIEALDRARRPLERRRGLWKALQAISRLAHAGCKAGDLEVTAFNGRLFSPRHSPLVEQRRDSRRRDARRAAVARHRGHRARPTAHLVSRPWRRAARIGLRTRPRARTGEPPAIARTQPHVDERKTTGSFYTPQALTEFLVRRTLSPLVEGRTADQILELRVVDPAMGSGAFLVAACGFLADACEQALIRDGQWPAGDVTAGDARVAAPAGRRAMPVRRRSQSDGGAAGAGVAVVDDAGRESAADVSRSPSRSRQQPDRRAARAICRGRPAGPVGRRRLPLPLFDDQIAEDVSARVMPVRLRLSCSRPTRSTIVKDKERAMAQLARRDGPLARWTDAADAWCAAALWPRPARRRRRRQRMDRGRDRRRRRCPMRSCRRRWRARARSPPATGRFTGSSRSQKSSSMPTAAGADGGFDAVIGNPPWDCCAPIPASSQRRTRAR